MLVFTARINYIMLNTSTNIRKRLTQTKQIQEIYRTKRKQHTYGVLDAKRVISVRVLSNPQWMTLNRFLRRNEYCAILQDSTENITRVLCPVCRPKTFTQCLLPILQ